MDEKFMRQALKQAEKAAINGDVPVGAVIVKDNNIIARAYNKKENTKTATDHAEIIAIQRACRHINDWRLNGCTIYVTLKPCSMCMGAILQSRIDKVVYGAESINDIENKSLDIHCKLLEEECTEILKNFFRNRRNS